MYTAVVHTARTSDTVAIILEKEEQTSTAPQTPVRHTLTVPRARVPKSTSDSLTTNDVAEFAPLAHRSQKLLLCAGSVCFSGIGARLASCHIAERGAPQGGELATEDASLVGHVVGAAKEDATKFSL